MKVPIRSDVKNEIKMLAKMIPWLQRGNIHEISFKPDHPATRNFRELDQATEGKYIAARVVKRGQRLFLVIDELEIDIEIQKFQYESSADRLITYLLEQHPGDIVTLLDMQGAIPEATGIATRDAFRKMRFWKAFERYFMLIHTKQKFQIINKILLSPLEVKGLLKAFDIRWQEPEQPSK